MVFFPQLHGTVGLAGTAANGRARARGGARAGKFRCVRIATMSAGSSIAAMIFSVPPRVADSAFQDNGRRRERLWRRCALPVVPVQPTAYTTGARWPNLKENEMKIYGTVVAASLALASGIALAHNCPNEMKAIDNAMSKASLTDAQAAEVKKLRAEGEKLHKDGKHSESMETLGKAKKILKL
jgi:hypothetical protein